MHGEELIEQGIVIKKEGDVAEISLLRSDACESCDSFFCKAGKQGENILLARDEEFSSSVGDVVRVAITGKSIYYATALIYIVPLVLLILGIVVGLSIFEGYSMIEVWAFAMGIGFVALYYVVLLSLKVNSKPTLPKIISVTTKAHH